MELRPKGVPVGQRAFNGLDNSICAVSCGNEPWGDLVDRHVVHAVDANLTVTVDAAHERAGLHDKVVTKVLIDGIDMGLSRGKVFRDVQEQVPTLRNVQQLHTTADAEYRHPFSCNRLHQHPIKHLAAAVHWPNGRVELSWFSVKWKRRSAG